MEKHLSKAEKILKIKELIDKDRQFVSLDINGIDKLYNKIRGVINGKNKM